MVFRRRRAPSDSPDVRAQIAELVASRRAIVDAYEVERRRIERDLHDGVQQYFVSAAMKVGEARLSPAVEADPELAALLKEAADALKLGLESLRKTVRGIHPQALTELGLVAAIQDVAVHAANPVRVVCPSELPELPEGVLAAGYFFTCEAIANAQKYAPGAQVVVLLTAAQELRISVVDEGPGGAVLKPGGGLAGMHERLSAFGGGLSISSPRGGPTQLTAQVPLLLAPGESGVVV
ncbi:sensor histidine kinase [Tessaracoccus sp. OH4464_COT-324]|uniref:sensor histidine kinase n=1 Tax=Tessaracoccus sp. OH4464_COT-324 TaxID=2491059 RepID=UPI000F62D2C1|nr:histidine kinase [Tessaracoccus sp. OH4464_COT-324]RRD45607.1 sensor histidine kinase [Tessaracoccus sp. OH4464_COT-324]